MINSGIYKITNIINGKMYIGSSNNCKRRLREHFSKLRHNKHFNVKLQFAFNKYGENNFNFDIIEYVDNVDLLLEREQYYLNTLLFADTDRKIFKKLGYNLNYKAERGGSYDFTDEMLKNMSERFKGSKNPMFNVKLSEEMKKQISDSLYDKYSGDKSFNYKGGYIKPKNKLELNSTIDIIQIKTTKTRQSEKSGKIILQYNSKMVLIQKWPSIKSASDKLNISRSSIKKCCEGMARHAGFFIWRYEDNTNVEYKYREKTIQQIDDNYNVVNEFHQIVIAAETLKLNRKYIGKALKTGKKYYGFYWKYKNN
jgi:group I intron endonuclease